MTDRRTAPLRDGPVLLVFLVTLHEGTIRPLLLRLSRSRPTSQRCHPSWNQAVGEDRVGFGYGIPKISVLETPGPVLIPRSRRCAATFWAARVSRFESSGFAGLSRRHSMTCSSSSAARWSMAAARGLGWAGAVEQKHPRASATNRVVAKRRVETVVAGGRIKKKSGARRYSSRRFNK